MKSWAVETIATSQLPNPSNSIHNGLAMVLSISYGLSIEYEGLPHGPYLKRFEKMLDRNILPKKAGRPKEKLKKQ